MIIYKRIPCLLILLVTVSRLFSLEIDNAEELNIEIRETFEQIPKLVKRHLNLEVIGKGYSVRKNPKKLDFAFASKNYLTKSQARKLVFDCTEVIAAYINSHEDLYPIIKNWGFDHSNLTLDIYIYPEGAKTWDPDIGFVSLDKNRVCFSTYGIKDNRRRTETRVFEPYEEALQLVQNYSPEDDPPRPIYATRQPSAEESLIVEAEALRALEKEISSYINPQ